MGINTRNMKLLAFAMGASFGGVSGAMFSAFQGFISPESFVLMESVVIVSMVVLGGMGHVPGVILGAILLYAIPEILRYVAKPAQEADAESGLKMTSLHRSAHISERARTVCAHDTFEPGGDFVRRLIPGDALEFTADFLERVLQPVGVVLVISYIHTFTADITFAFGVGFIRPYLHHAVIFHFDIQAAILRAKDTAGFMNLSHNCSFSPASCPGV